MPTNSATVESFKTRAPKVARTSNRDQSRRAVAFAVRVLTQDGFVIRCFHRDGVVREYYC